MLKCLRKEGESSVVERIDGEEILSLFTFSQDGWREREREDGERGRDGAGAGRRQVFFSPGLMVDAPCPPLTCLHSSLSPSLAIIRSI